MNCLFCLGLILTATLDYAAVSKRIALLPFNIYADKDLSYLNGGIFNMLNSRISKSGQVEVLSKAPVEEAIQSIIKSETINEISARRIGTRLDANFVLFGSLTILGNKVSIDAKMVDVSGRKPTMVFFDKGQELGAVITIINRMAAEINNKMIDSTQVTSKAKVAAAGSTAQADKPELSLQTGIYIHPEKILREEGYITRDKTQGAETLGNMEGTAHESKPQFWKSKAKNNISDDEPSTTLPPSKKIVPKKKVPQPKTDLQMALASSSKIMPLTEPEKVVERTVHREAWLLSQEASHYTIQIMGVHNEDFLLDFIKKNQLLKQNEIAYYQSTFNSEVWFQLLYGIYHTKYEAQLAVKKLPKNILNAKPWIRNISSVQKAIRDKSKL